MESRPWLLLLLALVCLSSVLGSALTTTIAANERTCFYAFVDKSGEKVRSPDPRDVLTLAGRLLLCRT